jgi:DNA-directed RNA polymerase subunit RPC12/RpoP
MSQKETLQGLSCPNCGGMVPIPEGQAIVRCPYCDLRSFVKGERGLRRYQVPQKVQRQNAEEALRRFLSSNMAIARNAARQALLSEAFLVYLPFWTVWGRVAGWAFGQEKVGSGNQSHYEPREVRVVQEMTWNGAACDVGEFGVSELPLAEQEMLPFNPDELHNTGMVFEPVNSFSEARQAAESQFEQTVNRRAKLDRPSQVFVRSFQRRFGLIYYPLWVLRYLYRGRAYQVVVDGYSGKFLFGKAPGNTIYRAAVLVLGMALGAFVAIDGTAGLAYALRDSDNFPIWLLLITLGGGLGLMYAAYRRFRYGEQYEYRKVKPKSGSLIPNLDNPMEVFTSITNVKDIEQWIRRLS